MIVDASNGVWSGTYILQIIIQEEFDTLDGNKLDFKDIKYPVKIRNIHKIERKSCCYCLQAFRTADILIYHIRDCFKVDARQKIKMPKKGD